MPWLLKATWTNLHALLFYGIGNMYRSHWSNRSTFHDGKQALGSAAYIVQEYKTICAKEGNFIYIASFKMMCINTLNKMYKCYEKALKILKTIQKRLPAPQTASKITIRLNCSCQTWTPWSLLRWESLQSFIRKRCSINNKLRYTIERMTKVFLKREPTVLLA